MVLLDWTYVVRIVDIRAGLVQIEGYYFNHVGFTHSRPHVWAAFNGQERGENIAQGRPGESQQTI